MIGRALALLLSASPVAADEVRIAGPEGLLAAMAIPVPGAQHVVVLIPGSGPTNRDGNGPAIRSDTYRMLAEALAEQGIASLRIDKRGMFASRAALADPNAVTLADYAADARAWVAEARDLAPCVWLIGHSEGGLVALLAATEPLPGLCGLILLSAPGRPLGRLVVEQVASNPLNALLVDEVKAAVAALERGEHIDPATIPTLLRPLFPAAVQDYLIDVFSYDPAALAAGWRDPVLIVQGDKDIQVTMADADLLAAAMPQAERLNLPGTTHMLKPGKLTDPMATYTDPALPLDAKLVPGITGFLSGQPHGVP